MPPDSYMDRRSQPFSTPLNRTDERYLQTKYKGWGVSDTLMVYNQKLLSIVRFVIIGDNRDNLNGAILNLTFF